MKEEKFKALDYIRKLIIDIDIQLNNFPHKDIELKERIRDNSYDILDMIYEANITPDLFLKKKLIIKVIAKIKVIDFLLNLGKDKEIIKAKKYISLAKRIDDIMMYNTGWFNSIENEIRKEKRGKE